MLFRDIALSVFRPSAYGELVRKGAARALLYLLVVSLPLALTQGWRAGRLIAVTLDEAAQAVAAGPDFRMVDGTLEFDGPMPYHVTTGDGKVVAIIDTTGATDRSVLAGRENFVLVLADRVIIRNQGQVQDFVFSEQFGPDVSFSRAHVVALLSRFSGWGRVVAVLGAAWSLLGKVFAALLLTFPALIAAAARGRTTEFGKSWTVACHALTLPVILGFVRVLVQADIAFFGLLYWGSALVYTIAGTAHLPPAPSCDSAAGPAAAGPPAAGPQCAGPPTVGPGAGEEGRPDREEKQEEEERPKGPPIL
ncbi:MAG TPA: hypothetical protein DGR79_03180 [Clostridiales bacterium]|nr:hypothetical protein [Clostridiales bacterium]